MVRGNPESDENGAASEMLVSRGVGRVGAFIAVNGLCGWMPFLGVCIMGRAITQRTRRTWYEALPIQKLIDGAFRYWK